MEKILVCISIAIMLSCFKMAICSKTEQFKEE